MCPLLLLAVLAQSSLPPHHAFGPDTNRKGVFTGAGITPLGLSCSSSAATRSSRGRRLNQRRGIRTAGVRSRR